MLQRSQPFSTPARSSMCSSEGTEEMAADWLIVSCAEDCPQTNCRLKEWKSINYGSETLEVNKLSHDQYLISLGLIH